MDELLSRHKSALVVVHGACPRGADRMVDDWCRSRGVGQVRFPSDWKLGRQAGYIRNVEMAQSDPKPSLCVAFWDGSSRGTANMLEEAKREGIETIRIIESAMAGGG